MRGTVDTCSIDKFTVKITKLFTNINESSANEYSNNRVLELVSRYLLDTVAIMRYEEFIDELLGLVREVAGHKEALEVGEAATP